MLIGFTESKANKGYGEKSIIAVYVWVWRKRKLESGKWTK